MQEIGEEDKAMKIKFELFGAQREMEIAEFTNMMTELCKAVQSGNENWKAWLKKNGFKVIG